VEGLSVSFQKACTSGYLASNFCSSFFLLKFDYYKKKKKRKEEEEEEEEEIEANYSTVQPLLGRN